MSNHILIINAGSSSIKLSLYQAGTGPAFTVLLDGHLEGIGVRPQFQAKAANGRVLVEQAWEAGESRSALLQHVLDWLKAHLGDTPLRVVGHRVVLGGTRYYAPVRITPEVWQELVRLIPLMPLHQPANLAPIEAIGDWDPALPQVACFDTSFHRTIPELSQRYGLPRHLHDEGIRGYGFHGLSYEYIASRLPDVDPRAAAGRTVVAHLGSGASLCALVAGKSVACTLGFSGLDGLLMGTRPGRLDPGIWLYLMQSKGMDARAIEKLLYRESGLLGVSGISNDMRDLEANSDPRAQEAIDLFVHRAVLELGSMIVAAGGLDALVFTAGIGENGAMIRSRICAPLGWLGVELDEDANRKGGPRISTADSAVNVWVISTDEELMIARQSWAVVSGKQ